MSDYVPIAKCRWCGEWVPCHADDFERPEDGTKYRLWSCPNCDRCLNLTTDTEDRLTDLDFKPEWVTHEEAEARTGWKRVLPEEIAARLQEADFEVEEAEADDCPCDGCRWMRLMEADFRGERGGPNR